MTEITVFTHACSYYCVFERSVGLVVLQKHTHPHVKLNSAAWLSTPLVT